MKANLAVNSILLHLTNIKCLNDLFYLLPVRIRVKSKQEFFKRVFSASLSELKL